MFTCNVIIPLSLWFKPVRRNMAALFVLCLFVNVGMWFERFVIIVTSLAPFNPSGLVVLPFHHRGGPHRLFACSSCSS
jgi:molybdopterin-containing oxidoreductase family membrane subunit